MKGASFHSIKSSSVLVALFLCFRNAISVTQAFSFAGGALQTFTVPPGVYTMSVTISGAGGSTFSFDSVTCTGGTGASVTGSFGVVPGTNYYIYLGSRSVEGSRGLNGAGSGAAGGSGGSGGSDIRTIMGDLDSRIIVAGGGGGCFVTGFCTGASFGTPIGSGAGGSTSGTNGGNGVNACPGATGGSGATVLAGGGGSPHGTLGFGGNANAEGNGYGAGGGGGLFGGGAGFRMGGGAGSSLVPAGGTVSGGITGNGACTITYEVAPTQVPTATPTAPTVTPTVTPTQPSSQPSSQPTIQPSCQPSSQPTGQPSPQPSTQPSRQPVARPSTQPSSQPFSQPSGVPSSQPSCQPSSKPSLQPLSNPTSQPSLQPSSQPSSQPLTRPTVQPSCQPSSAPSNQPSSQPSAQPLAPPSSQPSSEPSTSPSTQPTSQPTNRPSSIPSNQPVSQPSTQPSSYPSTSPTTQPSIEPSSQPSIQPSAHPTLQPSSRPTCQPSSKPTSQPTYLPSTQPTTQPSSQPSTVPSYSPSTQPSFRPSSQPSGLPSSLPSSQPSQQPSSQPSCRPTRQPTIRPSSRPSVHPSSHPSAKPSSQPNTQPSVSPSTKPSTQPSLQPQSSPSGSPSVQPTSKPSSKPSLQPTMKPSTGPSSEPTSQPSSLPSSQPSRQPTIRPTNQPSTQPATKPTLQPTLCPTSQPSALPTSQPSCNPSSVPSGQPTSLPSLSPSAHPTTEPSSQPSKMPSRKPSSVPSQQPTSQPTRKPSSQPSMSPTLLSQFPTFSPTWLSRSTVPFSNNHSVTVTFNGIILSTQQMLFKIVLPFTRVFVSAGSMRDIELYDVDISPPLSGKNYVLYGNFSSSQSNNIDLSSVKRYAGFVVSPTVSYDYSGRSVSVLGDINGDGHDDLIIGVPYAARCYVLFGTAQAFVNMTQGFTIFGAQSSDLTGWSVSGAGDVNNDTFADIVIGAPYGSHHSINSGAVYVIYGKQSGFQDVNVVALLPEQGFVIFGSAEGDALGVSVSSTGDVNCDAYDDIVVGALKSSSLYRGGAYVVYGSKSLRDTLFLSALKPLEGFALVGAVWSYSGYSVSGAGDVNGDGFGDILIGSVLFRTTFGVQTTYLVYGNNQTITEINLAAMTKQQGVVISGGGVVVSGVGDINHDGHDDILIGSNYGFNGAGFVVFTNVTDLVVTAAPSSVPSSLPAVSTRIPTRPPTTRSPTTSYPTMQHIGPSVPPTFAPTGPTFLPTSVPSTAQPSSRPSPTTLPSTASKRPSLVPSPSPSTITPSWVVPKPYFRSRNPVLSVQSTKPTQIRSTVVFYIDSGGSYVKDSLMARNYVIDTNETVHITGYGSSEGDIYTVLPQENGSLHIEIFNNISDKLNLTAHNIIHSMSDLVITSGSVIITFPTTGQRIRLANLTPLDISENNFLFATLLPTISTTASTGNKNTQFAALIIGLSTFAALSSIALYVFAVFYRHRKLQSKEFKAGIIALEDNPTRLIITVNDMYAHFDAYTPRVMDAINIQRYISSNHNKSENYNSENHSVVLNDEKSNEPSPQISFEHQMSSTSVANQNNTDFNSNNSILNGNSNTDCISNNSMLNSNSIDDISTWDSSINNMHSESNNSRSNSIILSCNSGGLLSNFLLSSRSGSLFGGDSLSATEHHSSHNNILKVSENSAASSVASSDEQPSLRDISIDSDIINL